VRIRAGVAHRRSKTGRARERCVQFSNEREQPCGEPPAERVAIPLARALHMRFFAMGRGKKKILLIDESVAGLLVGKMILGREAYDVVTARGRSEGIAKAFAERPDLIVMSAGSHANAHSTSVCDDLRANEGTRATPVLLVTTRPRGPSAARGGCDYVMKPIDGMDLLAKVRSRLRDGHDRGGET
jgi:PleD family two-component response regulator